MKTKMKTIILNKKIYIKMEKIKRKLVQRKN